MDESTEHRTLPQETEAQVQCECDEHHATLRRQNIFTIPNRVYLVL